MSDQWPTFTENIEKRFQSELLKRRWDGFLDWLAEDYGKFIETVRRNQAIIDKLEQVKEDKNNDNS